MVNKYNYTEDIIKEYQNAWWRNEFKIGNVSMVATFIIAITMLVLKFNNGSISILSSLLIALPILYFISYPIKKNKAIKMETEKYQKSYNRKNNKIEIKLENNNIIINSNGNKTEVEYVKVKKIIETKNLIVILLKGDMTISLKKDSFIDGTSDECKRFLKEKMKLKKSIKRSKDVQ